MVKFVEEELNAVRDEVLQMWELVSGQMKTVTEALLTADKERAWEVVVREKKVNASELKLDCDIEDFLVLYNPVAVDMRFIVAMLKVNTDLERIGDFAENIARFIIRQEGEPIDSGLVEATRDISLANSIFDKDNLVDEINAASTAALADYISKNPEKAAFCLDFKGVFLRLERAGDHITNLAEEIIFYIDAVVLKHSEHKGSTNQALTRKMQEGQE